jgi:hypothetical protein
MCFSVISSSAKRTEIHNQLNIAFFMLKIYLARLEKEQKPPSSKARWHRGGAQHKVPASPLLRKDKGGQFFFFFFGKSTNPKQMPPTQCFLFCPLLQVFGWLAGCVRPPPSTQLDGDRGRVAPGRVRAAERGCGARMAAAGEG